MRLPTGSRRVDVLVQQLFSEAIEVDSVLLHFVNTAHTVTISRIQTLNFNTAHRGSRTSSRLKRISPFVCAPPKQGLSWSCRLASVECAMSFPHHAAHSANYRVHQQQHARGSRNTQCATSPRSGLPTWPNRSHLHTCIQTLFSVSIARGFFTWSVPRLLGATPRFKFVLSQLFRTIVLLFASSFISRLERERLVFILSSSWPLDCEAVIGSAPFSLVQFVGLTVITVRLLEELPRRGSREPTEQM